MSFSSWSEFLSMGGYGIFVWSSYGLSMLVLAVILLSPALRHRQLVRQLRQRQRRQQRPESEA
jgi:heme exporter protein D